MSYGQQLTRQFLQRLIVSPFIEDFRPAWLFGMELDFYFEPLKFAVEFNGDQHIVRTDFGGDPKAQMLRDWRKRKICAERGVNVLTLEAVDLQYSVLRRKIKAKIGRENMTSATPSDLNALAVAYRKTLITNYDCVSARKKGKSPRKDAHAKRREVKIF